MMFAGRELAVRLERASAALGRDAVTAHRGLFGHSEAALLECGGGVAVFLNEESPLTQVRGAGMGAFSVDEVEEFYAERMAPVSFSLTPFADEALLTQLTRRGYEFGTFENVMVRELGEDWTDPDVEECGDGAAWAEAMAAAFFGEATAMGRDLGKTLFALPTCRTYMVRGEGQIVAGAQVDVRDGLAVLQCDGTVAACRGLGLQGKLIRARLGAAARVGCDLAAAEVAPGSVSQRNYERAGFRVAYTKITLIKPCF